MSNFSQIEFKGDYINGNFSQTSRTTGSYFSDNPGNTNDILGQVVFCVDQVAASIDSAKRGFNIWKNYFELIIQINEKHSFEKFNIQGEENYTNNCEIAIKAINNGIIDELERLKSFIYIKKINL